MFALSMLVVLVVFNNHYVTNNSDNWDSNFYSTSARIFTARVWPRTTAKICDFQNIANHNGSIDDYIRVCLPSSTHVTRYDRQLNLCKEQVQFINNCYWIFLCHLYYAFAATICFFISFKPLVAYVIEK